MSKNHRSLLIALGLGGGLSAALVGMWLVLGVHMNLSESVAGTFWYEESFVRPARGMFVVVCLPEAMVREYDLGRHVQKAGSCGGYMPLLKRIVAVPGDAITINRDGLSVFDELILNSRPYSSDGRGVQLPVQFLDRTVPWGYVAVLGETANSFDSRYFGLVSQDWIQSAVKKLW